MGIARIALPTSISFVLPIVWVWSGDGGDDAISDATVAACGGDLVGTWRVTSTCLQPTGTGESECPTATRAISVQYAGSVSYSAGLSYTSMLRLSRTETIGLPASCLTRGGASTTCAQLNQSLAAGPLDPSISTIHCSPAGGGGCTCVATVVSTCGETGTYATEGGVLTRTPTGSSPKPGVGFCVRGDRLEYTRPVAPLGLNATCKLTLIRD